jgi:hypothetical protein
MKKLLFLVPLGLLACSGNSETSSTQNTDSTSVATDTVQTVDHSGTYEYVNPYNDLDIIHNHYIVLMKNSDDTYSGRYYGPTDAVDPDRVEYSAGFFVLPMQNILIDGENLSFELVPTQTDFFNETVDLSMTSSADALAAGLTPWEVYAVWEKKSFTAKLLGGTISLENQVEEMNFLPMN